MVQGVSSDPIDAILADGPEGLADNSAKGSPDIRGKIIFKLMVVTVNPAARDPGPFDHQYVDIEWKRHKTKAA